MNLHRLLPPDDPVKTWRWCIAVAVAVLILDAMAGRGIIGGVLQYAYASDVAEMEAKMDMSLTLQLAETLRELREDQCNSNGDRDVIADVIEKYQQEYFKLNNSRYPLAKCKS